VSRRIKHGYIVPDRWAKYYDLHVCLSSCLFNGKYQKFTTAEGNKVVEISVMADRDEATAKNK